MTTYGIDTISAGGTIAWAMECVERGMIDAPWLRFGDGAALLRALDEIGAAAGLGVLLAEGSRRAAERVGGGSAAFARHVKGLELPGYEPRTLQAMALGLAVNARGADHNRSGAYEADLSGSMIASQAALPMSSAAMESEDRAAIMDSMILCKFLRGVFVEPFDEWARLLSAVTGWDVTATSFGERRPGSCSQNGSSTSAKAGTRPTTGSRTDCCPSRSSSSPGGPRRCRLGDFGK